MKTYDDGIREGKKLMLISLQKWLNDKTKDRPWWKNTWLVDVERYIHEKSAELEAEIERREK